MKSLQDAIRLCLDKGTPFYACRRQGGGQPEFGAQLSAVKPADVSLSALSRRRGFFVHPFDDTELSSCFIAAEMTLDDACGWDVLSARPSAALPSAPALSAVSQTVYERQAGRLIASLRRGDLQKVVLSRVISVPCAPQQRVAALFDAMCEAFPDAFVFLFYLPGTTLWLGASPELFLQRRGDTLSACSVAATKRCGDPSAWGEKERDEQQLVTDYIHEVFRKTVAGDVCVGDVEDCVAGNVRHLSTRLSVSTSCPDEAADALVRRLHPTPAVGGCPREAALRAIAATEKNSRRCYAGYLGVFDGTGEYDLFVNLRSMELYADRIDIHTGGGLTARSDARSEWNETSLKAEPLLRVVKQCVSTDDER